MIRAAAFVLALALAGGPALAAGGEHCTPIKNMAKKLKDVTVTTFTPGQYNVLRGFYMGIPPTMQGTVPGTGAVLIQKKGEPGGIVMWTRGSLYCNAFTVPPSFIEFLKDTKTGPLNDDGNEI